jgi:hypothetical protein
VQQAPAKRRFRDRRFIRTVFSLSRRIEGVWREDRQPHHTTPRWALHRTVELVVKKPLLVGLLLLPLVGGAVTAAFAPQATLHTNPSDGARAWAYVWGYLGAFGALVFVLYLILLVSAPYEQKRALLTARGGSVSVESRPQFFYQNAILHTHITDETSPTMKSLSIDVLFYNGEPGPVVYAIESAAVTFAGIRSVTEGNPLEVFIPPQQAASLNAVCVSTNSIETATQDVAGSFEYSALYRRANSHQRFRQIAQFDFGWPKGPTGELSAQANIIRTAMTDEPV